MDYFRKILVPNNAENQQSGAETIDKLVDRVQSSTLIEDRRDAMRALKSLSKKFRLEVGTQSMHVILDTLQKDSGDYEIVSYGLESLYNIMSDEVCDDNLRIVNFIETNQLVNLPEDLGGQFTEMFIKNTDNMQMVLSFVDEYDFHVRRHAIRLLIVLLNNRTKEVQEVILQCPMGVSKLLDLLSDTREVLRNDGILVLTELTHGNTNIQKIVAFENVFERILVIISEEGQSDGGVVVEDCLRLLLQLLKNNAPNQTLFKEGSYIRKITSFFDLSSDDTDSQKGWSAQKVANFQLMLQVVRTLVSPSNPLQVTRACQDLIRDCSLLQSLCSILMASGVPAEVLTETIHTVAESVRNCPPNQDYLSGVLAPSEPPQPAITVLLMSMVNERQPFSLRVAVLYCFQCYLFNNKTAQSQVVQTLLPKSTEAVSSMSAGQLLCSGLFSHDSLSAWFASVALLHSVHNNPQLKEDLLRVHLATTLGSRPVTLLQQCCNLLSQSLRYQAKVGLLMLLCTWLCNSPPALRKFLTGTSNQSDSGSVADNRNSNVLTMISELSAVDSDESEIICRGLRALILGICVKYNPEDIKGYDSISLIQSIDRRIGIDVFIERLSQVSKSEPYSKAMKRPQPTYKQPSEIVFDYEFTRLFRQLEHEVVNTINQKLHDESPEEKQKKMAQFAEHESVVMQYKELIKQQDAELRELRSIQSQFDQKYTAADNQINRLNEELQKLRDQNVLLKASKGPLPGTGSLPSLTDNETNNSSTSLEIQTEELKKLIQQKDEELESLRSQLTAQSVNSNSGPTEELLNAQTEIQNLSHQLEQLKCSTSQNNHQDVADVMHLQEENKELRFQLEQLKNRLNNADSSEEKLKEYELLLEAEKEEKKKLQSEMEDLMVLLSDQDTKLKKYKSEINSLGGEVSPDEDDEVDDEDEISD